MCCNSWRADEVFASRRNAAALPRTTVGSEPRVRTTDLRNRLLDRRYIEGTCGEACLGRAAMIACHSRVRKPLPDQKVIAVLRQPTHLAVVPGWILSRIAAAQDRTGIECCTLQFRAPGIHTERGCRCEGPEREPIPLDVEHLAFMDRVERLASMWPNGMPETDRWKSVHSRTLRHRSDSLTHAVENLIKNEHLRDAAPSCCTVSP